ncbi:MAG: type II toxin-antitoxin system RelE/ParE family toxin [Melioribacteraceae bacterium]|nr:type II toxin-antitoxin system RelE/ParE family toxin [Melioribacteraceae bacterium]
MNSKIYLSSKAYEDLDSAIEYYYHKNMKTAKEYYSGINKAINRLKKYLESRRMVPEYLDEGISNYREIIFKNFRIIYKTIQNEIFMIRILDARQLFEIEII